MNFLSDNNGTDYTSASVLIFSTNRIKVADSADQASSIKNKKIRVCKFEIADLDFWRGEAYSAFFENPDNLGGFYYEVKSSVSPTPLPQIRTETVRLRII